MKIDNGPAAVSTWEELRRDVPLSDDAEALTRETAPPAGYVQRLLDAGLDADAGRVLAYTMPVRLSVWWGCLCAWHATAGEPADGEDAALRAAVHWVLVPSKKNREQAGRAAAADRLETAAGCCAKAVSLAGSAAAEGEPLVVDELMPAARTITGALALAYNQARDAGAPISYRQMTFLGLDVADGKIAWLPLPE